MESFIVIGGILLCILIKVEYDKKTRKKKLEQQLKKAWGEVPKEEFTAEKLDSMKAFYEQIKREKGDIDEITWNDLDFDQIFMTINNTCSACGEEYLYAMLRQPCFENETLMERNRLITFFAEHEEERLKLQKLLSSMGKMKSLSVYKHMNRLELAPKEKNTQHYLMIASLFLSGVLIAIQPAFGILALVCCIINNIVRYYKRKGEIEIYFEIVRYIVRLLDNAKAIGELNIPEITEYALKIKKNYKQLETFKKGSYWLVTGNPSGSLADILLDYVRMFFHVDLIKFNLMLTLFETKKKELNEVFELLGFLDTMIAIASFRELMQVYCIPELKKSELPFLDVKEIYHPMIDDPVKNSIHETRGILLTGSNASGKSTFIKTLAINAILAQTIDTAMCDSYQASFFMIASSMALQDNLFNNESYYIVEIKSLKRILDMSDDKIPTLCFVDEVLRGTNTLERIAASSRILLTLSKKNTLCCAATHDIELTQILEDYFSNYHFQEQVIDDDILFDYKLYKGRAVSRNAIKLLGMLGYDKSLIASASDAANEFLETGEWKKIKSEDIK